MKPMTTTTRERLVSELAATRREADLVNRAVWGVAIGVMIYGAVNVYGLLVDHDVNPKIAWLLSPIVDLGLCAALWAGAGLSRHDVPGGWVNVLRWVAGLMTWGLNIAGPLTHHASTGGWSPDWLGVGIHTCGPLLLLAVAEAAASYRHKMHKIIARLEEQERAAREPQDSGRITPAPVRVVAARPVELAAGLSSWPREDSVPALTADRPGLSPVPLSPSALPAGQDSASGVPSAPRPSGQDSRPVPEVRTERSERDTPPAARTARPGHSPRPQSGRHPAAVPAVAARPVQAFRAVEVPVQGEAAEVADLLLVGREVAAELAQTGKALSRPTLIEALRVRKVPVATSRAAVLTRVLKAEQAAATEAGDTTESDESPVGDGQPSGQDTGATDGGDSTVPAVQDSPADAAQDSPEDIPQDRPNPDPRDSEDSTTNSGGDSLAGPAEDSAGG